MYTNCLLFFWYNSTTFAQCVRYFLFLIFLKTGRPRINYPLENHDRNSLIDGLVVAARIAAASGAVQIGSSFASMGLRDLPSVRKTGKKRNTSLRIGLFVYKKQ